jgi:hypothetical protein
VTRSVGLRQHEEFARHFDHHRVNVHGVNRYVGVQAQKLFDRRPSSQSDHEERFRLGPDRLCQVKIVDIGQTRPGRITHQH